MGTRVVHFINPFGTGAYDDLLRRTMEPLCASNTELRVSHLEDCPRNIDYYYYRHLMETSLFEAVMRAQEEGAQAVIIGCCFDPGLPHSRELVDIPVVGPLEATMALSRLWGYDFVLLTDHRKAVHPIRDLVKLYDMAGRCTSVRAIDWYVWDMVKQPREVAEQAVAAAVKAREEDGADLVILACTVIAACVEGELIQRGLQLDFPLLNPNTVALKTAEAMADLHALGRYEIARKGYYGKPQARSAQEFDEVRATFGAPARKRRPCG